MSLDLSFDPSTAVAASHSAAHGSHGSSSARIALVCDDAATALPWQRALGAEGVHCHAVCGSGDTALGGLDARRIDALLLLVAGGLSPQLGRLRALRQAAPTLPLLVTCSGLRELDQILALELGADDVLDATVSGAVVAARLRAVWRRQQAGRGDAPRPRCLQFGNLLLALDARRVTLAGRVVPLTEGEFEVLWLLASSAGQTLSRHDILKRVRGLDDHPLDRSIDSRVYRIRAKLGDSGRATPRIRTVRNRGYVFSPSDW